MRHFSHLLVTQHFLLPDNLVFPWYVWHCCLIEPSPPQEGRWSHSWLVPLWCMDKIDRNDWWNVTKLCQATWLSSCVLWLGWKPVNQAEQSSLPYVLGLGRPPGREDLHKLKKLRFFQLDSSSPLLDQLSVSELALPLYLGPLAPAWITWQYLPALHWDTSQQVQVHTPWLC